MKQWMKFIATAMTACAMAVPATPIVVGLVAPATASAAVVRHHRQVLRFRTYQSNPSILAQCQRDRWAFYHEQGFYHYCMDAYHAMRDSGGNTCKAAGLAGVAVGYFAGGAWGVALGLGLWLAC